MPPSCVWCWGAAAARHHSAPWGATAKPARSHWGTKDTVAHCLLSLQQQQQGGRGPAASPLNTRLGLPGWQQAVGRHAAMLKNQAASWLDPGPASDSRPGARAGGRGEGPAPFNNLNTRPGLGKPGHHPALQPQQRRQGDSLDAFAAGQAAHSQPGYGLLNSSSSRATAAGSCGGTGSPVGRQSPGSGRVVLGQGSGAGAIQGDCQAGLTLRALAAYVRASTMAGFSRGPRSGSSATARALEGPPPPSLALWAGHLHTPSGIKSQAKKQQAEIDRLKQHVAEQQEEVERLTQLMDEQAAKQQEEVERLTQLTDEQAAEISSLTLWAAGQKAQLDSLTLLAAGQKAQIRSLREQVTSLTGGGDGADPAVAPAAAVAALQQQDTTSHRRPHKRQAVVAKGS
ncbi:hypothetical protein V8C86DRAFT_3029118 [Haematococcus lacustris]